MLLKFEPVCRKDRKDIEALQMFPSQSGYIESVVECLEEADWIREWRPVGIYDEEVLVGFAMYGFLNRQRKESGWIVLSSIKNIRERDMEQRQFSLCWKNSAENIMKAMPYI